MPLVCGPVSWIYSRFSPDGIIVYMQFSPVAVPVRRCYFTLIRVIFKCLYCVCQRVLLELDIWVLPSFVSCLFFSPITDAAGCLLVHLSAQRALSGVKTKAEPRGGGSADEPDAATPCASPIPPWGCFHASSHTPTRHSAAGGDGTAAFRGFSVPLPPRWPPLCSRVRGRLSAAPPHGAAAYLRTVSPQCLVSY